MDPFSQAFLGASLSQSITRDRGKLGGALIIGALSGMAADLDVLIRSDTDPLLFLEYHRQFSHSLAFIPVGALVCALFFYFILRRVNSGIPPDKTGYSFKQVYLLSFAGYATHGLLDACTSYGTQLFWPFSSARIAWNTVSIVDPLFTLPLLVFILLAIFKHKIRYAQLGLAYAVIYLSLGQLQKMRALDAAQALAQQRGQQIERLEVKPSFANRHLWKIIYQYDNRYYVDAVKLLWQAEIITGTSVEKLDIKRDFPWLPENSQQARDIQRFRWFSNGFLAVNPENRAMIMDARYSMLPNTIKPMWGIVLNKKAIEAGRMESHVSFVVSHRLNRKTREKFIKMLF